MRDKNNAENAEIPWGVRPVFASGVNGYSLRVTIPKRLARVKGIKERDGLIFKTLPDGTITISKVREAKR